MAFSGRIRSRRPLTEYDNRMDSQKVGVIEVLAVKSPLPLRGVCDALQARLGLPDFTFAAEAEGEWAISIDEGIEYCVSRPFQPIAWPEAGTALGSDSNVGVSLLVEGADSAGADREPALKQRTPQVAQGLADALGEPVIHHLTWRPDRIMVLHDIVFHPAPLDPDASKPS